MLLWTVHPVSDTHPRLHLQSGHTICPGANANGVKELVIAGMLLAARDIRGGMQWVADNKADAAINKTMEKAKKAFAGSSSFRILFLL